MTEIPEHLLQRSRERRAAMGGGGGDDAGDSGGGSDAAASSAAPAKAASAAPAPSMPAHPAPAEDPPPPPASPMAQAHENRKKIPYWAMGVLAFVPLWAYIFVGTLDPPPAGAGPETLGEEDYAAQGCAGCHGGAGGGGVGPAFTGGAVYETFPSFIDHFDWVRLGSTGWLAERGDTYGATNKPVGGGMPGYAPETIDDAHLIYVILHERGELAGENPDPADAELLELVAEYLFEHPDDTLADALAEVGEGVAEEAAG